MFLEGCAGAGAESGAELRVLRQLQNAVAAIWRQRADRYSEVRTANTVRPGKVEMSYIGG